VFLAGGYEKESLEPAALAIYQLVAAKLRWNVVVHSKTLTIH
jgi:hypothetical protein